MSGRGVLKLSVVHLQRHTKIVATLGPASDAPETLDRLLEAGVDVVRLNCSHGDHDDLRRRSAAVRQAAARAGRFVGVLFDLQGPKLRLSSDTAPRDIGVGEAVTIVGATELAHEGDLVVSFPDFVALVTEQSEIVIGDGVPRFEVDRIEGARVHTRALTPGPVSPRKGVNVTYARPNLPAITEKDDADLLLAAELGADFVALSFVRSAADVEALTDRLRAAGSRARTIAKIEKVEAYEDLDNILEVADAVMVARGDYGVEAGIERVPLMQKDTIYRATQVGKTVITATQMLESMINAPEPTRAEAADVANAVIDGTSAVMLSAETGVGRYPVEAVLAMGAIAHAAEDSPVIHGRARSVHPDDAAATILHHAVELGEALDVAAFVIPSASGGSVRACSKYRADRPIIALVHDDVVGNQLTLEWGVIPKALPVADTVDDLIEDALVAARDHADIPTGSTVLLTAGRRTGTPGATSLVMVREVP